LTPVAAAYGLTALDLPPAMKVMWLGTFDLIERTISSILEPINLDKDAHICVSLDAEWNLTRRVGVSIIQIAPHSHPDEIYIIPVCIAYICWSLLLKVMHH